MRGLPSPVRRATNHARTNVDRCARAPRVRSVQSRPEQRSWEGTGGGSPSQPPSPSHGHLKLLGLFAEVLVLMASSDLYTLPAMLRNLAR